MGNQPMTRMDMDDVERQTSPHGDTVVIPEDKKTKAAALDCRFFCTMWLTSAAIVLCVLVSVELLRADTQYYVAIDSVSGGDLRNTTDTDGLSFNLTLGVASRSFRTKGCIKHGSHVEVAYRGVQLAASAPEVGRLCVKPRMQAERRVVATATGVPVGHVLDSLVADMQQGMPALEVTLHRLVDAHGGTESWVSGCGRQRVGAEAAWCDYPNEEPTFA